MKKTVFALVALALAGSAVAAGSDLAHLNSDATLPSGYNFEVGFSNYSELYEEFSNASGKLMQEAAPMTAIRGKVSRDISGTDGTVVVGAEYAFGNSVYTGAYWGGQYGDIHVGGLSRYAIETTVAYQHAAPMWNGVAAEVGLGYRRLVDNLQEAGPAGYKRINERTYLSLGIEKPFSIGDWTLTPAAKFKHILQSGQWSDLEGGIKVSQRTGHGSELSVAFSRQSILYRSVITPFYRTWRIQDSDVSPAGIYEPRNKTVEAGVALTFQF